MNPTPPISPTKRLGNRILFWFFQGLVLVAPVAITVYVLRQAILWVDSLLQGLGGEGFLFPGAGILIILTAITLIGFLASNFITGRVFRQFDRLLNRLPLVKLIYSSVKDLLSAVVGDKRKFDQPVFVRLSHQNASGYFGFITSGDLAHLDMPGYLAVYTPHSYAFSGILRIVPAELVTPLNAPSADVMKFIVAGGVTGLEETVSKPA